MAQLLVTGVPVVDDTVYKENNSSNMEYLESKKVKSEEDHKTMLEDSEHSEARDGNNFDQAKLQYLAGNSITTESIQKQTTLDNDEDEVVILPDINGHELENDVLGMDYQNIQCTRVEKIEDKTKFVPNEYCEQDLVHGELEKMSMHEEHDALSKLVPCASKLDNEKETNIREDDKLAHGEVGSLEKNGRLEKIYVLEDKSNFVSDECFKLEKVSTEFEKGKHDRMVVPALHEKTNTPEDEKDKQPFDDTIPIEQDVELLVKDNNIMITEKERIGLEIMESTASTNPELWSIETLSHVDSDQVKLATNYLESNRKTILEASMQKEGTQDDVEYEVADLQNINDNKLELNILELECSQEKTFEDKIKFITRGYPERHVVHVNLENSMIVDTHGSKFSDEKHIIIEEDDKFVYAKVESLVKAISLETMETRKNIMSESESGIDVVHVNDSSQKDVEFRVNEHANQNEFDAGSNVNINCQMNTIQIKTEKDSIAIEKLSYEIEKQEHKVIEDKSNIQKDAEDNETCCHNNSTKGSIDLLLKDVNLMIVEAKQNNLEVVRSIRDNCPELQSIETLCCDESDEVKLARDNFRSDYVAIGEMFIKKEMSTPEDVEDEVANQQDVHEPKLEVNITEAEGQNLFRRLHEDNFENKIKFVGEEHHQQDEFYAELEKSDNNKEHDTVSTIENNACNFEEMRKSSIEVNDELVHAELNSPLKILCLETMETRKNIMSESESGIDVVHVNDSSQKDVEFRVNEHANQNEFDAGSNVNINCQMNTIQIKTEKDSIAIEKLSYEIEKQEHKVIEDKSNIQKDAEDNETCCHNNSTKGGIDLLLKDVNLMIVEAKKNNLEVVRSIRDNCPELQSIETLCCDESDEVKLARDNFRSDYVAIGEMFIKKEMSTPEDVEDEVANQQDVHEPKLEVNITEAEGQNLFRRLHEDNFENKIKFVGEGHHQQDEFYAELEKSDNNKEHDTVSTIENNACNFEEMRKSSIEVNDELVHAELNSPLKILCLETMNTKEDIKSEGDKEIEVVQGNGLSQNMVNSFVNNEYNKNEFQLVDADAIHNYDLTTSEIRMCKYRDVFDKDDSKGYNLSMVEENIEKQETVTVKCEEIVISPRSVDDHKNILAEWEINELVSKEFERLSSKMEEEKKKVLELHDKKTYDHTNSIEGDMELRLKGMNIMTIDKEENDLEVVESLDVNDPYLRSTKSLYYEEGPKVNPSIHYLNSDGVIILGSNMQKEESTQEGVAIEVVGLQDICDHKSDVDVLGLLDQNVKFSREKNIGDKPRFESDEFYDQDMNHVELENSMNNEGHDPLCVIESNTNKLEEKTKHSVNEDDKLADVEMELLVMTANLEIVDTEKGIMSKEEKDIGIVQPNELNQNVVQIVAKKGPAQNEFHMMESFLVSNYSNEFENDDSQSNCLPSVQANIEKEETLTNNIVDSVVSLESTEGQINVLSECKMIEENTSLQMHILEDEDHFVSYKQFEQENICTKFGKISSKIEKQEEKIVVEPQDKNNSVQDVKDRKTFDHANSIKDDMELLRKDVNLTAMDIEESELDAVELVEGNNHDLRSTETLRYEDSDEVNLNIDDLKGHGLTIVESNTEEEVPTLEGIKVEQVSQQDICVSKSNCDVLVLQEQYLKYSLEENTVEKTKLVANEFCEQDMTHVEVEVVRQQDICDFTSKLDVLGLQDQDFKFSCKENIGSNTESISHEFGEQDIVHVELESNANKLKEKIKISVKEDDKLVQAEGELLVMTTTLETMETDKHVASKEEKEREIVKANELSQNMEACFPNEGPNKNEFQLKELATVSNHVIMTKETNEYDYITSLDNDNSQSDCLSLKEVNIKKEETLIRNISESFVFLEGIEDQINVLSKRKMNEENTNLQIQTLEHIDHFVFDEQFEPQSIEFGKLRTKNQKHEEKMVVKPKDKSKTLLDVKDRKTFEHTNSTEANMEFLLKDANLMTIETDGNKLEVMESVGVNDPDLRSTKALCYEESDEGNPNTNYLQRDDLSIVALHTNKETITLEGVELEVVNQQDLYTGKSDWDGLRLHDQNLTCSQQENIVDKTEFVANESREEDIVHFEVEVVDQQDICDHKSEVHVLELMDQNFKFPQEENNRDRTKSIDEEFCEQDMVHVEYENLMNNKENDMMYVIQSSANKLKENTETSIREDDKLVHAEVELSTTTATLEIIETKKCIMSEEGKGVETIHANDLNQNVEFFAKEWPNKNEFHLESVEVSNYFLMNDEILECNYSSAFENDDLHSDCLSSVQANIEKEETLTENITESVASLKGIESQTDVLPEWERNEKNTSLQMEILDNKSHFMSNKQFDLEKISTEFEKLSTEIEKQEQKVVLEPQDKSNMLQDVDVWKTLDHANSIERKMISLLNDDNLMATETMKNKLEVVESIEAKDPMLRSIETIRYKDDNKVNLNTNYFRIDGYTIVESNAKKEAWNAEGVELEAVGQQDICLGKSDWDVLGLHEHNLKCSQDEHILDKTMFVVDSMDGDMELQVKDENSMVMVVDRNQLEVMESIEDNTSIVCSIQTPCGEESGQLKLVRDYLESDCMVIIEPNMLKDTPNDVKVELANQQDIGLVHAMGANEAKFVRNNGESGCLSLIEPNIQPEIPLGKKEDFIRLETTNEHELMLEDLRLEKENIKCFQGECLHDKYDVNENDNHLLDVADGEYENLRYGEDHNPLLFQKTMTSMLEDENEIFGESLSLEQSVDKGSVDIMIEISPMESVEDPVDFVNNIIVDESQDGLKDSIVKQKMALVGQFDISDILEDKSSIMLDLDDEHHDQIEKKIAKGECEMENLNLLHFSREDINSEVKAEVELESTLEAKDDEHAYLVDSKLVQFDKTNDTLFELCSSTIKTEFSKDEVHKILVNSCKQDSYSDLMNLQVKGEMSLDQGRSNNDMMDKKGNELVFLEENKSTNTMWTSQKCEFVKNDTGLVSQDLSRSTLNFTLNDVKKECFMHQYEDTQSMPLSPNMLEKDLNLTLGKKVVPEISQKPTNEEMWSSEKALAEDNHTGKEAYIEGNIDSDDIQMTSHNYEVCDNCAKTKKDDTIESSDNNPAKVMDSPNTLIYIIKQSINGDEKNIDIMASDLKPASSVFHGENMFPQYLSIPSCHAGISSYNDTELPYNLTDMILTEKEKKLHHKLELIRLKFLYILSRMGANTMSFNRDHHHHKASQQEHDSQKNWTFSCNILVLGKIGVGKSSTINSIIGEERTKVGAFDDATANVRLVSSVVDGMKINIIDTPGLRTNVMGQGWNKKVLYTIKSYTKKCPPDIILYVDRLDSWSNYLDDIPLLRTITTAFGKSIWINTIVTFTHAASVPPDNSNGDPMTYETFIAQRSHIFHKTIQQATGDKCPINAISFVENHINYWRNCLDKQVLTTSQDWRNHLLILCYPTKPKYQSKVSFNQKGMKQDTYIDVDDYSKICDDEYEYGQLCTLLPLMKTQFNKLIKGDDIWEHEYNIDGANLEKALILHEPKRLFADKLVEITKEVKKCIIHFNSAFTSKHVNSASNCLGNNIQNAWKQLAYCLWGEITTKNAKHKTIGGLLVTFFGDTMLTRLKVEDWISIGESLLLLGRIDAMRAKGTTTYGVNMESHIKTKYYPINQLMVLLCLSLIKMHGEIVFGIDLRSQCSLGKHSKMALHIGLNNMLSGQINLKMSNSKKVLISLLGLVPLATSMYKSSPYFSKHN
uniref:AIG1-type G domain-containing protein n=1 Tax=Oryza brachyantha TaxID=4533 RepID=J3KZS5_ORYBR